MKTRVFRLTVRFLLFNCACPLWCSEVGPLSSKAPPLLFPFHSGFVICSRVGYGCLALEVPYTAMRSIMSLLPCERNLLGPGEDTSLMK